MKPEPDPEQEQEQDNFETIELEQKNFEMMEQKLKSEPQIYFPTLQLWTRVRVLSWNLDSLRI